MDQDEGDDHQLQSGVLRGDGHDRKQASRRRLAGPAGGMGGSTRPRAARSAIEARPDRGDAGGVMRRNKHELAAIETSRQARTGWS